MAAESTDCFNGRQPGLLDPVWSLMLGLLIWLPYQVYNLLSFESWKLLAKQLRSDTKDWDPSARRLAGPLTTDAPHPPKGGQLSQNLELIKADEDAAPGSPHRLVLFYAWLTSKPHHIRKYSRRFTDAGVDVLRVKVSIMDVLHPTSGTQVVARQVVQFLLEHPQYQHVLLYGFSVGAYAFCEASKLMHEDPQYAPLRSRFVGHIWDSPVDLPNMPIGIATTLSSSAPLQALIVKYIEWFLKVRYQVATRHYQGSAHYMHAGPVPAPALYFYSQDDPMSGTDINQVILNKWRRKGLDVQQQEFECAPHCGSFLKYPEQYNSLIQAFLKKVDFLDEKDTRRQAKA